MGMTDHDPDSEQIAKMVDMVRQGMRAGAIGLSSGLYYAPGSYSKTDEVVAMARMAAQFGGVYRSHIRDEGDYTVGVVAAVQEVITIAEQAGLIGVVTHMKALGPANHGLSMALVERIEAARARGVQVYADQYAYNASGTGIGGALIPRWAQVGGRDALMKRIRGPERPKVVADVKANIARRGGADTLLDQPLQPGSVIRRAAHRRARAQGRPTTRGVRARSDRARRREPRLVQHVGARHRAHHAAAVDDDVHRRRPGADGPGQAASRARTARFRASSGSMSAIAASSICRLRFDR